MTETPVRLEALLETRETLIATMIDNMPIEHRRLLLGFKKGEPDWSGLGLDEAAQLPAVQWKFQNLATLSDAKRRMLVERLERILFPH